MRFILASSLLSAALLGGCALSDDKLSTMMVAPGKFALYTCPELVQAQKENVKRQRELDALMVRAGQESSGRVVNAVAYRPEYLNLRGELKDLRSVAVERECALPDPATMVIVDEPVTPPGRQAR